MARDAIDHAVRARIAFSEPHAPLESEDITRGIANAAKQHAGARRWRHPAGAADTCWLHARGRSLRRRAQALAAAGAYALHRTDSRPRSAMSRPWQESFIDFSAPLLW